jgi:hypothetical protein
MNLVLKNKNIHVVNIYVELVNFSVHTVYRWQIKKNCASIIQYYDQRNLAVEVGLTAPLLRKVKLLYTISVGKLTLR